MEQQMRMVDTTMKKIREMQPMNRKRTVIQQTYRLTILDVGVVQVVSYHWWTSLTTLFLVDVGVCSIDLKVLKYYVNKQCVYFYVDLLQYSLRARAHPHGMPLDQQGLICLIDSSWISIMPIRIVSQPPLFRNGQPIPQPCSVFLYLPLPQSIHHPSRIYILQTNSRDRELSRRQEIDRQTDRPIEVSDPVSLSRDI